MKKTVKGLIIASFVVYLLALFYLIFLWHRGYWNNMSMVEYALFQMNLIPFKTIGEYVGALFNGSMNLSIPITNLMGNLLMFFPMGIYLPLFSKKKVSIKKYLLSIILILLVIEVLQFITKRGAFDIDDLILNLSGACLGFLVYKKSFLKKLKKVF